VVPPQPHGHSDFGMESGENVVAVDIQAMKNRDARVQPSGVRDNCFAHVFVCKLTVVQSTNESDGCAAWLAPFPDNVETSCRYRWCRFDGLSCTRSPRSDPSFVARRARGFSVVGTRPTNPINGIV